MPKRTSLQYPTDPFTTLELQNPSNDAPELYKIYQSPDHEAPFSSKKAQDFDSIQGAYALSILQ